MIRWFPVPVLTGSLLLAGCGTGGELAVPLDTMVEFEAAWQCDVTRYSFADSQAIEAKQDEVRIRFGIDPSDHVTFTAMLAEDADLRESVAELIDSRCPALTDEDGDE